MNPTERIEKITEEVTGLVDQTDVALVLAYPFDHKVVALHELKTGLLDDWGRSKQRNFKIFHKGETGGIRGAVREYWNSWVFQVIPRRHVGKFIVEAPVVLQEVPPKAVRRIRKPRTPKAAE